MSNDITQQLQSQILESYKSRKPLKICAGNSKNFYGHQIEANCIDTTGHNGIISYEPTELVITARSGTSLKEIESTLDKNGQILPFEPPHFADTATIGGTVACNLSGPRRAYTGAARDFVLGSNIINGKAEKLKFGGQVMKNVAGYDASRLMCGAMGTLGLILDVSLKVLPKPETEITLGYECDIHQALDFMHHWVKQSLPVSGSYYDGTYLYIRLSGNNSSVSSAQKTMGGDVIDDSEAFWKQIKEQTHDFFNSDKPLWRLSLASNNSPLNLTGNTVYEWGGALRWLSSDESEKIIRAELTSLGGHATLFKNNKTDGSAFHPLNSGLLNIHKQLKSAFDPENILNPGRMYKDF
ncbi:MAG: glycolate oxidase subunit GlcE [endosymbiont of Galathealinum brachiosum]|uniref:Glycolate oxidase subunit GlcE n=1 Tax=endosymbiont of Galathealinum brachiosum TaxID=2200906 RepID=A0A370D6V5_9GAMM|nr:MAG: glycolate oxidase subunit GlcE [endosymbiont of Galathealinum brachiosum]